MKKDIMPVLKEIHKSGYLNWRLNATFVTLIPKKEGDLSISDFRPISLLSGIYKIIGKLLANRVKGVTDGLLIVFQYGRIEGRQIHEGIIIANELIDSRLKSRVPGLMAKLDFQKAFDMVSWAFLDKLMETFGFGFRWRSWLKASWISVRFSIIIDGSPVGFFVVQRGSVRETPSPLYCSLWWPTF